MPWRLIQFILILAIFLVFAGLNLQPDNSCNINFGFKTIEHVPVFFPVFFSFLLGMLCALPYIIKGRIKSNKGGGGSEKKPARFGKKKKTDASETQEDSSFSDGGPYGVN